jgi:cytoskeletal protein CcmA (bactofilin family)
MAMLKRDEPSQTPSTELNALLGRGSEFEGKLTFEGTVRIDGKFTGSIVTGDVLVVGEGAKISAEISCGTIIVHGEVTGNIRAKNSVELHHPAKMRGNVETPSLMVEKGVLFEGQAKMENLSFDKSGPSKGTPAPAPTPISAVKS